MSDELKKLDVTTAEDLANKIEVKPEKLNAKPVVIVAYPGWMPVVDPPTPLQLIWAWFVGYASQEVSQVGTGNMTNPISSFSWIGSVSANWWKWLLVLVAIGVAIWQLS
jgi:hypothetical protein